MASQHKAKDQVSNGSRVRKFILYVLVALSLFGVTGVIFLLSVFGLVVNEGSAMRPTIYDGDYLLVSRLVNEIHRGDLVIFAPVSAFERRSGVLLLKRIIGVPGDTIAFVGRELYVNGELLEEPYIRDACNAYRCPDESWILGTDQYFVLGDNRNASRDSRSFGPISRDNISRRVVFIFNNG